MDPITQFILSQGLAATLGPLLAFMRNTPLEFTTTNAIVSTGWKIMVGVADSFLVLFAVVGILQILHGRETGTPYMPIGQFLSRMILTVIMVHLSFMLGQDLLILNNLLCGLVTVDIAGFIQQVTGGQGFTLGQASLLNSFLLVVFSLSLVRIAFQAVKRLVFFNLLFVLSGPAFLASFLPQTSAWFAYWIRTYIVTIFTQFFQYLAFGLGWQFFVATQQNGLIGFLIAIAMLNMVAEIPGLLARFATTSGASVGGVGGFVRTGITAAMLFV